MEKTIYLIEVDETTYSFITKLTDRIYTSDKFDKIVVNDENDLYDDFVYSVNYALNVSYETMVKIDDLITSGEIVENDKNVVENDEIE